MSRSCRLCGAETMRTFVDLGMSPLSNSYLGAAQLDRMEPFYPLHVVVCEECRLVQLPELERAENIFDAEYAYFSSFSTSWLAHCERHAEAMIERRALGSRDLVVEVASNDGYLLQYFARRGVPVLGIEPAGSVARVAREQRGIPTLEKFFGIATARELVNAGHRARLLVANNVLAHVPDLRDFVAGMKILLAPDGICTIEFPHLLRLIEHNQFDTIYHEHFSYLSLETSKRALEEAGLTVFDVDELPTHGGSLRVHARHAEAEGPPVTRRVGELLEVERASGLHGIEGFAGFGARVSRVKRDLLDVLIHARRAGERVVAYGAAAKGNTLLNFCGIRTDMIEYAVDRSPHKQGLFLPGTHIPILAPEQLEHDKPDVIVVLPWNLKDEILAQLAYCRRWGARFVIPIPQVEIITA